MAGVTGIVASGVQDISGLLPLLGTEKCEYHVGSALTGGYIFAAATPLSIFGSPGIFRAGCVTLVASLGASSAKKLADVGLQPAGDCLPMITIADHRYVAETRFMSILNNQLIDNVENLTITWRRRRWNCGIILSSLIGFIISLSPYLYFIFRDHDNHTMFTAWAYPVARALGSFLTAIMVQFVVQHRIVTILKKRLIYMTMQAAMQRDHGTFDYDMLLKWSPSFASDRLRQYLGFEDRGILDRVKRYLGFEKRRSDAEAVDSAHFLAGTKGAGRLRFFQAKLDQEIKKHFPPAKLWAPLLPIYQVFLFVGLGLSLLGYVGCFSIVQGSHNAVGPLLWLGLECVLSITRMILWAVDPLFDENTDIRFKVESGGRKPGFTGNKSFEEMETENLFPVDREQDFLEEVASRTSPLPHIGDNNVSLYYTYGAFASDHGREDKRVLCITVVGLKERGSVTLVRHFDSVEPKFFTSSLEVNSTDGTLAAKVIAQTDPQTHNITKDTTLLGALTDRCELVVQTLKRDAGSTEMEILALWTMRVIDNLDYYLKLGELETRKTDLVQGAGEWISAFIERANNNLEKVGEMDWEGAIFLTEWEELENFLFLESAVLEEQLKHHFFEVVGTVDNRLRKKYNREWAKGAGKRLAAEKQQFHSRCMEVRSVTGLDPEVLTKRRKEIEQSILQKFTKTTSDSDDAFLLSPEGRRSSLLMRLKEFSRHFGERIRMKNVLLTRNRNPPNGEIQGRRDMENRLRKEKDALIIRLLLKDLMPSSEWNFQQSHDDSIASLDRLGSKYFPVFSDTELALLVVAAQGLLDHKIGITAVHFHWHSVALSRSTILGSSEVVAAFKKLKSIMSFRNFPLVTPPTKNVDAAVEVLRTNKNIMSMSAFGEDSNALPEEVIRLLECNRREAQARTHPDFDFIVFYDRPYIDRHHDKNCLAFSSDVASGTSECVVYIYTRMLATVRLRITHSCVLETKFKIQYEGIEQVEQFARSDGFRCREIQLSHPLTVGFHELRVRPTEAPYQCWLSDFEVEDATVGS